jgi:DNA ligase-1
MSPLERACMPANPKYIKLVETIHCDSEDDVTEAYKDFLNDGYEGAILRSLTMPYEGKRSVGLLKLKTMEDSEFEVCGVEEGKGKLMGKAGAIWCYTDSTKQKKFKAKMEGELESLEEYYVNIDKYLGRSLTVRFQNLTPDGVPRFPVGVRFREAE